MQQNPEIEYKYNIYQPQNPEPRTTEPQNNRTTEPRTQNPEIKYKYNIYQPQRLNAFQEELLWWVENTT